MAKQTWHTENSSRITDIEFDPDTGEMDITFKRGGVYRYKNIDALIYTALITAESVGKAFNEIIVPNADKYPYEKLS